MARILAERADRSVHLDADAFFDLIVSGQVAPWLTEAHEQNQVVMGAVVDAAARYASGGYLTIVDGIVIPGWFFEPLRNGLRARGSDVSYAVLRPSMDLAVRRARRQTDQAVGDPDVVRQLWESFADLGELERHVISIDEAEEADAIASRVGERFEKGELAV